MFDFNEKSIIWCGNAKISCFILNTVRRERKCWPTQTPFCV